MSPTPAAAASAVCLVLAAAQALPPLQGDGYVWHGAPPLSHGWTKLDGPVADDHLITVRFSLQKRNVDQLHRAALSVSEPRSPFYGQHLAGDRLGRLTAPEPAHVKAVEDWLSRAEIQPRPSRKHGELEATMTIRTAGRLLDCRFHRVSNPRTGQLVVQARDYWLPADVEEAVAAVYGLHGLPLPRPLPRRNRTTWGPASVTPAVLERTYSVSGVKVSGSGANRQAVAEFQGQTMMPSDLAEFFRRYVQGAPASDHKISKFVGKHPTGSGGIEASLDVDYIMGVAPGVPTEFWYWGGEDFCGDLKSWTTQIIEAGKDGPLVHSVSYGWQGRLDEIGCEASKVSDIDHDFATIAAMGITIVFASGDSGSAYVRDSDGGKLYPSWPASSPWITAVGSTRFQEQKVGHPEMATDQFGSGGGFSSMFEAFESQIPAVQKYLRTATGLPPPEYFPAGGRATPDVSALGEGYQVVADGEIDTVGGTSASAPTFAGLVSLLNEVRIQAGRPPMGYLNPWLYQNPDAFTDVTMGTDKIDRDGDRLKYGFDCADGWDPVTGLGTPIFSKMLAAAMKAPFAGTAANSTWAPIVV